MSNSFTLRDLVQLLCLKSKRKTQNLYSRDFQKFEKKLDWSLLKFLQTECLGAVFVQNYTGIPLLVETDNKKILFDGLLLQRNFGVSSFCTKKICHLVLERNTGSLLFQSESYHRVRWSLGEGAAELAKFFSENEEPPQKKNTLFSAVRQCLAKLNLSLSHFDSRAEENPRNLEETCSWLDNFQLRELVSITYLVKFGPNKNCKEFESEWLFAPSGCVPRIHLVAFRFRKSHSLRGGGMPASNSFELDQLHFKIREDLPSLTQLRKKLKVIKANEENSLPPPAVSAEDEYADLHADNRSSSVTVSLEGLTHAVKMGLLTRGEAQLAVSQLSKLVFSLWLHFDCHGKVQQVCLRNGQTGKASCHEIFSRPDDENEFDNGIWEQDFSGGGCSLGRGFGGYSLADPFRGSLSSTRKINAWEKQREKCRLSWKAVFDQIWQESSKMVEGKKAILQKILDPCGGDSGNAGGSKGEELIQSSLSQRINSLVAYTERTKVILFGREDQALHALKFWFAEYLFSKRQTEFSAAAADTQRQRKRQPPPQLVTLKTIGQNELVCLHSKKIDIENVAFLLGGGGGSKGGFESVSEKLYSDQGEVLWSLRSDWSSKAEPEGTSRNQNCQPNFLPFFPVTNCSFRFRDQQLDLPEVFSPGKVSVSGSSHWQVCKNRGEILTEVLQDVYSKFCCHLFSRFGVDVATCRFTSLASISFKCIWLSFFEKGGPLSQSVEKMKPFYERQVRKLCRGGFSFSFQDQLASGELLYPEVLGSEARAKAMVEYDLTSSYGYSASKMQCPGGFCVGFSRREEDGRGNPLLLFKTDKKNRSEGFEFKAAAKFIHNLMTHPSTLEVESVFSNFSPLGLFYVKKYPLDLAIVFRRRLPDCCGGGEENVTYLVQFDGRFVHGCRGEGGEREGFEHHHHPFSHSLSSSQRSGSVCRPLLNRHVGYQSEEELRKKTRERDLTTENWIEVQKKISAERKYFYFVITDCHHASWFGLQIDEEFKTNPELRKLKEPYQDLCRRHSVTLSDIVNCDKELNFILIGRGRTKAAPAVATPPPAFKRDTLMIWRKNENGQLIQDLGWQTDSTAIFTRETLEHATTELGFQMEAISFCFFFRNCHNLQKVFRELLDERRRLEETNKSQSKFLKCVLNYSTGMFGFNPHKRKASSRKPIKIRQSLVCRKEAGQFTTHFAHEISCIQEKLFFVIQSSLPQVLTKQRRTAAALAAKQHISKPLNVALPLYTCIVEYGKLRLLRGLQFIQSCTKPDMTKLAYSQVDNLVLALGASNLEEAVEPSKRDHFEQGLPFFFTKTNQPGCFKKEWDTSEEDWKFVSPFPCNYTCLRIGGDKKAENNGHTKMSLLSGSVSPSYSYPLAVKMLNKLPCKILQERRINKVCNRKTKTLEVNLGGNLPLASKRYKPCENF